jgi:hypothetical protein
MSKLRFSATSLIVTGLFLSCSDSGSSGGSVPIDDLPAKYAAAFCAALQNCVGPAVFSLYLGGNDCVDVTTKRLENGTFALLKQKIAAGTIKYDGTKAQACFDTLGSLTCDGLLQRDQPECLAAMDGVVALGGDCDINEDCAGSAICQSSAGTCPAKCVALLTAGQACSADGDCVSGLQCSSETKLCVKPAALGENCEYGSPPCSPGLLCLGKDYPTPKTPGVCRSPADAFGAAVGTACDPVAGTLCTAGASCVADHIDLVAAKLVWTCVTIGSYPAGGACKPGFPEACTTGNYCQKGTQLIDGTCTALPDAKQPCGAGFSSTPCQPGAVCVSNVCENYAANGVSCTGNDMCYSGYCGTSGGCQQPLPCQPTAH